MKNLQCRYLSEVRVWIIDLKINESLAQDYRKILSVDENDKADRFCFAKDRINYIACRFALRQLLGELLDQPAHEIRFDYSKFQKPYVRDSAIGFNVSHTNELALIALAPWPVGIDIEWHLREIEADELASRFFSRKEAEAFSHTEAKDKIRTFYSIWTKKEAVIKAVGEGLSYPLDSFHVGILPADDTLEFEGKHASEQRWQLKSLKMPFTDYSAAVVAEGSLENISMHTFNHGLR